MKSFNATIINISYIFKSFIRKYYFQTYKMRFIIKNFRVFLLKCFVEILNVFKM